MIDSSFPPGWRHNPSGWRARLPGIALALGGCGLATYLSLYQLNVIPHVWEPFFGNGSRRILKESSISHMLPVPDALIGAVFYLLEAIAECVGGRQRWRSLPWWRTTAWPSPTRRSPPLRRQPCG